MPIPLRPIRSGSAILSAIFACLLGSPAWADEAACLPLDQYRSSDTALQLTAGVIIGEGRAHFLQGGDACPADTEACRMERQPFLLPGYPVAAGQTVNGFTCVHYAKRQARIDGWLPANRIGPADPPDSRDWIGDWVLDENSITLRPRGDALHANALAVWEGRTGPHSAEFEAEAVPNDNHASFNGTGDHNACRIEATLLGPMLELADNRACGGLNVTFTGLYVHGRIGPRP